MDHAAVLIPLAGDQPSRDDPANLPADPQSTGNSEAIQEWLTVCAYEKCSEASKEMLASIGQSVGRQLNASRPDLGVLIRQTEPADGAINSSHWSVFEVYVILGKELGNRESTALENWSTTTAHAIKIKSFIKTSTQPVGYTRKLIARAILDHSRYESQRPMRADGKLRSQNKRTFCRLQWEDGEKGFALLEEHLSSLPGISAILCVEPEAFAPSTSARLAQVSEFARQEFQRMCKGKNRTLLIALAARFLEIPITSKPVLDACGAKASSGPSSTLQKYLHTLGSKDVFSVMDKYEKKSLVAHFLDELRGLVIQWATVNRPFISVPSGTSSP